MATQMTIDKIIVLVLIALVIFAVVIFLVKPDLLNWIRGLPEYKYEYDEEIIPGEGKKAMNLCPEEMPFGIGTIQISSDNKLYILLPDNTLTKIYITTDNEVKVDNGWIWESKIGFLSDKKIIKIDKEWISGRSFYKYIEYLPSRRFLLNLDESIIFKPKENEKLFILCRKEKSKIEIKDLRKPVFISEENEVKEITYNPEENNVKMDMSKGELAKVACEEIKFQVFNFKNSQEYFTGNSIGDGVEIENVENTLKRLSPKTGKDEIKIYVKAYCYLENKLIESVNSNGLTIKQTKK